MNASNPTVNPRPAPSVERDKPAPRPKWLLFYLAIALFDLLTVCVCLYLNHEIMSIYRGSVEVNQKWALRLGTFDELKSLAGDVNAPGNDVFDSQDVGAESARMRAAKAAFDQKLLAVRAEINTEADSQARLALHDGLDHLVSAMDEMLTESALIFSFFAKGDATKAGERMATMDRKYAQVNAKLSEISREVRKIQETLFERQLRLASELRQVEYAIALAIVLMILGAMVYGRRVWLKLEQDAAEKERFTRALEEAKITAENASVAKSQFLANMSHEIRTPMNGVLGMTEILLGTNLTAEQRRYADTVHRSGESLLATINDILDFSKVDAGKLELDPRPANLGGLVEDVCELLAPHTHGKGVELVCFVGADVPKVVQADSLRVRQVLMNLIGNAVKFTDRGEIVVKLEAGSAPRESGLEPKIALRFSVRDTGPGIAESARERVFDAFAQADSSTARRHGGTGLGLAISRHLATLMGGRLSVDSRLGEGSTFAFEASFPVLEPAALAAEDTAVLKDRSILVVDDNPTNREILSLQLGPYGARVDVAASPHEALALMRDLERPYDAAVIDLQIPGMDGLTLAARLKSDPQTKDIPLLVLSSVSRALSNEELTRAGVYCWMDKPARGADLARSLATMISARAAGGGQPISARVHYDAAAERPEDDQPITASILLAEDNPVNQHVARTMLGKLGCTVTIANNGLAVLAAVAENRFDLILMDCQMPEMDGYEATAAVRDAERRKEIPHSERTPIVALTANAMAQDRERCLAVGMDDHLAKPFSRQQLAAMLRRWLKTRAAAGTVVET